MMHGGGRNVAVSFVLAGGTSGTNLWVNVGCWTQESQLPSSENEQEGEKERENAVALQTRSQCPFGSLRLAEPSGAYCCKPS